MRPAATALTPVALVALVIASVAAQSPATPYAQADIEYGSRVYAAGAFTTVAGQARHDLAALDATTGAVLPWNPDANGEVVSLALSGSVLYAGGVFTTMGGQPRPSAAAVDAASGLATPWSPVTDGYYLSTRPSTRPTRPA